MSSATAAGASAASHGDTALSLFAHFSTTTVLSTLYSVTVSLQPAGGYRTLVPMHLEPNHSGWLGIR